MQATLILSHDKELVLAFHEITFSTGAPCSRVGLPLLASACRRLQLIGGTPPQT